MDKSIDIAVGIIKQSEGCKLTAYKCPAGVWTIGWGSTGADVVEGIVWTQAQADARLAHDVTAFATGVDKLVKVPVTPQQRGALIDFAYNLGLGALGGSTLLKKLNAGDYAGAADEFPKWNKGGGKVLPGLVKRREAEKQVFLQRG